MNENRFVEAFRSEPSKNTIRFATIDLAYSEGNPKVTFDGEANLSTKTFPHLASFTPLGGERVMVINGVIIGAIKEG